MFANDCIVAKYRFLKVIHIFYLLYCVKFELVSFDQYANCLWEWLSFVIFPVSLPFNKTFSFVTNRTKTLTAEACERHPRIWSPEKEFLLSYRTTFGKYVVEQKRHKNKTKIVHVQKTTFSFMRLFKNK
jgi:hypothetical protein